MVHAYTMGDELRCLVMEDLWKSFGSIDYMAVLDEINLEKRRD